MGLPPVVVGLAVYLLLSRSGSLGPLGWLFTPKAMILAQSVIAFPLVTGITMTAVTTVPAELFVQVRSLGASRVQANCAVLREARAGVLVALAAGFGRIISEVGAALMVGGNIRGHTQVLTTAIVQQTGHGAFALALALASWLLGLTLAVNVLILSLQGRPQE
jgi:tungstate transport system permease protein